jgi:hypothetical protein
MSPSMTQLGEPALLPSRRLRHVAVRGQPEDEIQVMPTCTQIAQHEGVECCNATGKWMGVTPILLLAHGSSRVRAVTVMAESP